MSNTDAEIARETFEGLTKYLGAPMRGPAPMSPGQACPLEVPGYLFSDTVQCGEVHPVFQLTHHFRSHDKYGRGYTKNRRRGGHLSIPCVVGGSSLAILEVSFHKGETFVEWVTFPDDTPGAREQFYGAAVQLLTAFETR